MSLDNKDRIRELGRLEAVHQILRASRSNAEIAYGDMDSPPASCGEADPAPASSVAESTCPDHKPFPGTCPTCGKGRWSYEIQTCSDPFHLAAGGESELDLGIFDRKPGLTNKELVMVERQRLEKLPALVAYVRQLEARIAEYRALWKEVGHLRASRERLSVELAALERGAKLSGQKIAKLEATLAAVKQIIIPLT